jgi:hypothetical protein
LVRRFEPDGEGGWAASFDVVLTPLDGKT